MACINFETMKTDLAHTCAVLYFALVSCQPSTNRVIETVDVPQHKLVVEFWGENGGGWTSSKVTQILILDKHAKTSMQFIPIDVPSLDVNGYYLNVCSKSGKYLAFPRGRFDGFSVVESASLLAGAKPRFKTVKLELSQNDPAHFFGEWTDDHRFWFSVGLNNDYASFEYDAELATVKMISKSILTGVATQILEGKAGEFKGNEVIAPR